jgi:phosphatidylinositol alpha 1,6-mannosyltransferase
METLGKSLRIAVVTETFLPQVNGVTNSVLRVLEFCRAAGHEVLVIAPESLGSPREYLGYKIKHVPSISMKKLIPMAVPQKSLEPLIEGFNPDVIHLASPIFLGHYVTKIARRLNIPTVSIYQTDIAGFARHYKLTIAHSTFKKWIARIHSSSDITLAPSEWARRDLIESGVGNVHLWKRGVDLVRFHPNKRTNLLRSAFDIHPEKTIIGYVGRLANEKRIEDLEILDSQEKIQIVIVGDGPSRMKLERVLPNAIFLGHQSGEELAKLVASFDIFVHTGKHETFCQSIQEALASGVPVIGPNSGGPVDLIEEKVTGLLVNTSDPSELLSAADFLITHPRISQMRIAARESVAHRSWDYINGQLMDYYYKAIGSRRTPREEAA